jgi:tellurite resistance protein TerC
MLLAMNDYINPVLATLGISWNMPHIEVPTTWSLAIIFGVLVISMGASYLVTKRHSGVQL